MDPWMMVRNDRRLLVLVVRVVQMERVEDPMPAPPSLLSGKRMRRVEDPIEPSLQSAKRIERAEWLVLPVEYHTCSS